jgi:hypothetical protein
VAERKAVLIRIDPRVHSALERWARDDLRSVNAQIEFLLRDGLRRAGRLAARPDAEHAGPDAPRPSGP